MKIRPSPLPDALYAGRILPALAETMHCHSNTAIAERIMVGFARARRLATAQQSA